VALIAKEFHVKRGLVKTQKVSGCVDKKNSNSIFPRAIRGINRTIMVHMRSGDGADIHHFGGIT
jgi:hypothetical protein